ncbi:type II secretion system F family protein [Motiliproteus coralliicola]|uniref:General secretion pathway protein F n=1 Tax=Motiliproteus coralliicola TaxID=2283196 RepID=A0A369WCG5_9GAMM|nr:type II secretion system F family protein [Motiliproteus coralliicola]RDE18306.1 type II secretion system F family protein [Motiliproteus coralliicola]
MATFKYTALNPQGKEVNGTIEAEDINQASAKLRSQYGSLKKIRKVGVNPLAVLGRFSLSRYTSAKAIDKVLFFRQLALMLRSGNTLTQALEISSEMCQKRDLQKAIQNMLMRIQSGSSFAVAVEAQGRVFPPVAAKLIATAEISGELQSTLERLAENLERSAAVKRQLISSMTYPAILLLVAFGVFIGLAVGIVPKFAKLLEGKSQQLPPISQAMLDTSAWLIDYGPYVGSGLLAAVFLTLVAYTTGPGKAVIDRVLLNLPVIGTSIRTSGMAQMGWTLSMLLGSGLTVLESLRVISGVLGNRRLELCFEHAAKEILSGHSLAYGLRQSHIPIMVQHMTGIGERSGELEHVMTELGKFYQSQSEIRIKKMMGMIEPAMTLVIGGMVAFVYIGFFKAMMQVSAG